MARYLDPKNDFIFRRIFGEHKNLCISLLNSLLPLDTPIESIEYLPSALVPRNPLSKESIVDVRCTDQKKRRFIVEMQMQWTDDFKQRVLFNASKVYVRQLGRGKKYKLLQPVYSLNLVNETFDETTKEFYHHYKIVNIANTKQQIKGLEFIFVELSKFKPQNVAEKKLMVLWLRYLTEMENLEKAPPELLKDQDVAEAVRQLKESSYTEAELETYERYQDAIGSRITLGEGKMKEGIAKGMKKGLAKGKAEGLREGLKKGEAERQELAKALKAKDRENKAKDAALEANAKALEVLKKQLEEMKKREKEGRRS